MKNKYFKFLTQILLTATIFIAFSSANAQQPNLPANSSKDDDAVSAAENGRRPGALLQRLNLTPDQINQIRIISRDNRALIRAAVQRQREARRALDSSIYADQSNEQEVRRLAAQFAAAQAEVIKINARTEFLIRQVLTRDQLISFRELRRREAVRRMQSRSDELSQPERRMRRKLKSLRNNSQ